jgi:RNA polymerase sigma-70 factor (ECF subfamily)
MPEENTTAVVQRYQDELTGEAPGEPVVRPLLDRAVLRLDLHNWLEGNVLRREAEAMIRPVDFEDNVRDDSGGARRL